MSAEYTPPMSPDQCFNEMSVALGLPKDTGYIDILAKVKQLKEKSIKAMKLMEESDKENDELREENKKLKEGGVMIDISAMMNDPDYEGFDFESEIKKQKQVYNSNKKMFFEVLEENKKLKEENEDLNKGLDQDYQDMTKNRDKLQEENKKLKEEIIRLEEEGIFMDDYGNLTAEEEEADNCPEKFGQPVMRDNNPEEEEAEEWLKQNR